MKNVHKSPVMKLIKSTSIMPAALALAMFSAWVGVTADTPPGSVPPKTEAQFNSRMAWWREARFGMFIHWGLYSVAAGEFDSRQSDTIASWLMHKLEVPPPEYEKLLDGFTAECFDPRAWAKLAKEAGMKYAVITTKHHEGFCLFDSAYTDYDVMRTPAKRDLIKEWVEAFREAGLKVGFYYSLIDWHHPHYPVRNDPFHPARNKPEYLEQQRDLNVYVAYMHNQVRELMTRYGKIDVLWFDFSYGKMAGATWRADELVRMVRELQPGIIINNRLYEGVENRSGDFLTPEQYVPATGLDYDWETCMTINDTWGFKKNDENWKSARTLIRHLADITSKGGNYLLNVGPKPDGTIPEASAHRLREIGRWMHLHGESIYGAGAGPFPRPLPWGRVASKPGRLYLHVFDWPRDGILIVPGLVSPVQKAYLLSDPGRQPLGVSRGDQAVAVAVPAIAPDAAHNVVVLEIEGCVQIAPEAFLACQSPDGTVILRARDADIHGQTVRYDSQSDRDSIGYWTDSKDWISWDFTVTQPGVFSVEIRYGCAPGHGGGQYEVEVGHQTLPGKARETDGWFARTSDTLGTVELAQPGRYTLAIKLKTNPGLAVMDLQTVTLRPNLK